jgi:precorrin-6B methylase 2
VEESLRLQARSLRAGIASGAIRGARLVELLRAVPFADRDAWADELLGLDVPPPDVALPRGAVPYLPCGVDEIVAAVLEAPVGADDVLVDIGSGLGRVVMLAHLLSGAHARGIEIQPHLVERARAYSAALQLSRIAFTHADAASIELDGSVFFLYAPCNGELLARVLERLAAVAQRRRIVVAAVGLELDVPWLRARRTSSVALTLYDSPADLAMKPAWSGHQAEP